MKKYKIIEFSDIYIFIFFFLFIFLIIPALILSSIVVILLSIIEEKTEINSNKDKLGNHYYLKRAYEK